eukprot:7815674-Pyramimonas_sp.AAC.1
MADAENSGSVDERISVSAANSILVQPLMLRLGSVKGTPCDRREPVRAAEQKSFKPETPTGSAGTVGSNI